MLIVEFMEILMSIVIPECYYTSWGAYKGHLDQHCPYFKNRIRFNLRDACQGDQRETKILYIMGTYEYFWIF
jgi:hypothetical protein